MDVLKNTKSKLKELVENPEKIAKETSIKNLELFIKKANKAYYNTGQPIVNDVCYDIIIDIFRKRNPNNKILNMIGAPIRNDIVKLQLPFWMGSMDKVKPNTRELENWLGRHHPPYIISQKLDGLSGLLTFNIGNQNEIKLYTRGDGTFGQDISHLIPFLKLNAQKYIERIKGQEIGLRGEFIMKKSIFQKKYASEYPKARSLISGSINAKEPNINVIKDMDFVIYEVIYNIKLSNMSQKEPIPISAEDQFKTISKIGFDCVDYKIVKSKLDSDYLIKLLIEMKTQSPYEIDGIIITDNLLNKRNKSGNPKYAVAFKSQLEEQIAITTVVDVEWNPSKRGFIIPRIKLKPCRIGGDTITYTTGFNAKYIKDNLIGIGSKLKIIRSGDVIPYIMEVLSSSNNGKGLFPNDKDSSIKYKWVKTKDGAESIHIELLNKSSNKNVLIKQLVNFFTTLKIVGVSEGTVTKMVNNGFNNIKKICTSAQTDFILLPNVKEKSAENIHRGIHNVIDKPIKLHKLMTASNCFNGLALKKLKVVVDLYPNIMTIPDSKITLEGIQKCEGYSDITSQKFIDGLRKFKKFMKENDFLNIEGNKKGKSSRKNSNNKSTSKKNSIKNNNLKLDDLYIVFSGVRDMDLEDKLTDLGATIQSSVNTKTNLVVVKDINSNSSKIKKAKELGIVLMTHQTFKKMV